VAEGARLESVFRGNSNVGSNPTLSAIFCPHKHWRFTKDSLTRLLPIEDLVHTHISFCLTETESM
jgi:hypothetical protein